MKSKLIAASLGLALLPLSALADYPERAITMIVPWSAGGGTDATGRIIATLLEKELGQPINVVNRTGGGGVVGHEELKASPADGYTIGIATTELNTYKPTGAADLTAADFTIIGVYNADPSAIFVGKDSRFDSLAALLAEAKDKPEGVAATGANFGGNNHLAWVSLIGDAGGAADKSFWVPTDGAVPSLQLLASRAVDLSISQFPEAKALVDAGEIRPLAYLGNEPHPAWPDVPPVKTVTGKDFAITGWRAVAVPKGTPDAAVEKLTAAVAKVTSSDEFKAFMAEKNFGVTWYDGAALDAFITANAEAFATAITAAGLAK